MQKITDAIDAFYWASDSSCDNSTKEKFMYIYIWVNVFEVELISSWFLWLFNSR
jgi:hypothetical protein